MRALPFALSAASRDLRGIFRRAKRNMILIGLAAASLATAYLAGLAALAIYLSGLIGPLAASLVIAGGMAGIGVIILITLAILKKVDERRNAKRRTVQRLATAAAISILPQLMNRKSLAALAALGGLAFLASRSASDSEV